MAGRRTTKDPDMTSANGNGSEAATETLNSETNGEAAAASEAARRAEEAATRAEQAAAAGGSTPPAGTVFMAPAPGSGGTGGGVSPNVFTIQGLPQLPAPEGAKRRRDWTFWVPVTTLAVLASAGLLAGLFFIGRETRPSDQDISGRIHRSVARQHDTDHSAQTAALASQKVKLNSSFNRRLRKAKKTSYTQGQNDGYSSGQSAGYASGQSVGHQSGVEEGQVQGYSQGHSDGVLEGFFYGE